MATISKDMAGDFSEIGAAQALRRLTFESKDMVRPTARNVSSFSLGGGGWFAGAKVAEKLANKISEGMMVANAALNAPMSSPSKLGPSGDFR